MRHSRARNSDIAGTSNMDDFSAKFADGFEGSLVMPREEKVELEVPVEMKG